MPSPCTLAASALAAVLLALPADGAASARARHFELVNASRDSVVAVEIAPPGGKRFRPLAIGERLRGGGDALTLAVPAGDCLRDLRVGFRDGTRRVYHGIDTCNRRGLRLGATDARRPGQDRPDTGTAAADPR